MVYAGIIEQVFSAIESILSPAIIGLVFSGLVVLFAYLQTKINKEQKELVEFQHTSFPYLEQWDVIGAEEYYEYTNDKEYNLTSFSARYEFIELELSNIGQAPATDLRCQVHIRGGELGWELDGALERGEWRAISDKLHDRSLHPLGLNPGGAAIGSDEKKVKFTTPIVAIQEELEEKWDRDLNYREYLSPTEICRLLYEEGEDSLILGLSLWLTDGTGDRDPMYISFVEVSESDFIDFERSLKKGKPLKPEEVSQVDRWWS